MRSKASFPWKKTIAAWYTFEFSYLNFQGVIQLEVKTNNFCSPVVKGVQGNSGEHEL
jgi:hypothetical protein